MKIMVDPPHGWLYGFPKALPEEGTVDIRAWLIKNGYPKEDVDFAILHCRMWEVENKDEK
jgi:hypothetical protein